MCTQGETGLGQCWAMAGSVGRLTIQVCAWHICHRSTPHAYRLRSRLSSRTDQVDPTVAHGGDASHKSLCITSFSIEHSYSKLSPNLSTAPKGFEVWGHRDQSDAAGTKLGRFTYVNSHSHLVRPRCAALGFGRVAVSEIERPNVFMNLIYITWTVVQSDSDRRSQPFMFHVGRGILWLHLRWRSPRTRPAARAGNTSTFTTTPLAWTSRPCGSRFSRTTGRETTLASIPSASMATCHSRESSSSHQTFGC